MSDKQEHGKTADLNLVSQTSEAHLSAELHHLWICNAYGLHSGPKSTWRTVTGEAKSTHDKAQKSAMDECNSKLFACRPSGCWEQ